MALRKVLKRLSDSGLTLNCSKCDKIAFVGVVFGPEGISTDPEKVRTVNECERPQNVKELRSFLGMTNYCSRCINGYAEICEPMRELTHKDTPWEWKEKHEKAFVELKHSLSSDTVMAYYDPEKPVEVTVDASPIGLGAILVQDKIVSYASRALTSVESRYSQVEREALAVVWACEHFDLYLRGLLNFTFITDHKPLDRIWQKTKLPSLRIERWSLRLQPYKFAIKYEPVVDNIADCMSRHPLKSRTQSSQDQKIAENYVNFIMTEAVPKAISLDEIRDTTMSPTLQKAIEYTRTERWYEMKQLTDREMYDMEDLTALRAVRDELTVHSDNVLLRDTRIVLPVTLRDRAISVAHEGHQGIAKTKSFIRSKVWFLGIDGKVESAIKGCMACQILTPERESMEPLRMS